MADPVVYIDYIDTLEMKEKWGVVESVVRVARVVGLTGTDYATMAQVLDNANVPSKGDILDGNHPHLIVTDRDIKMVDRDKADVTLAYGGFNDKGQPLYVAGTVAGANVAGKMTTSMVQKDTNLYREDGVGEEKLITVQHTYPETDPDYGGKTVKQSGLIGVSIPQRTFTIEGVKEVKAPWEMAERLNGAINNDVWMGQPKWTWMCTEVTWEHRKEDNYFMSFQFQHNPDTWNYTAVFTDERTQKPPENLVKDVGFKTIKYHRPVNFVQELGFYLIGPAQTGPVGA